MARKTLPVSIYTIAKNFRCSAATVSKALSNNLDISSEMRQQIRAEADRLGFRPNTPRKRSFNLCVLMEFWDNANFNFFGYSEAVLEGVLDYCREQRLEFSIFAERHTRLNNIDLVRELYTRNVDGVILFGLDKTSLYYQQLDRQLLPYCCIYDGPAGRTVRVDNHKAGRLAAEHLIERGHRKIAIAQQPPLWEASIGRQRGYEEAMKKHGLPIEPYLLLSRTESEPGGVEWGKNMLRNWLQDRSYTALIALSENVVLGFLSEAHKFKVSVPEDVAVITFDDLFISRATAPPLTVVDIPNRLSGYRAAQYVHRLLENGLSIGDDLTQPLEVNQIIVRESTCRLRPAGAAKSAEK